MQCVRVTGVIDPERKHCNLAIVMEFSVHKGWDLLCIRDYVCYRNSR
jgi:hypothetical protein